MDIEYLLKKADLALRPQALFINPSDRSLIIEGIPDIEDKLKIYESDIIEKGTAYLMDRGYLDDYIQIEQVEEV